MKWLLLGALMVHGVSAMDERCSSDGCSSESASPLLSRMLVDRAAFNLADEKCTIVPWMIDDVCERLQQYDTIFDRESDCRKKFLGWQIASTIRGAYEAGVDLKRNRALRLRLAEICGRKPLLHGVIRWTSPECIKAVLAAVKCNACNVIAVQDDEGNCAEHLVARFGYAGILAQLYQDFNSPVDMRNNRGETPLICAAYNCPRVPAVPGVEGSNHGEAVRVLCDLGADVRAVDVCGQSALHKVAVASEDEYCVSCEGVWQELIERGADLSLKDINGRMADDIRAGKPWFSPGRLFKPIAPAGDEGE